MDAMLVVLMVGGPVLYLLGFISGALTEQRLARSDRERGLPLW